MNGSSSDGRYSEASTIEELLARSCASRFSDGASRVGFLGSFGSRLLMTGIQGVARGPPAASLLARGRVSAHARTGRIYAPYEEIATASQELPRTMLSRWG